MNNGIFLDTKKETLPVIHVGDYGFRWVSEGNLEITNRANETKTYSVDALDRMSRLSALPLAVRNMAGAALDWAQDNPYRAGAR